MYQLKKISTAIAAIGLSTVVFMGQSVAATTNNMNNNRTTSTSVNNEMSPVTNGVSQQLTGDSKTVNSLNKLLPTIKYTTDNLPAMAKKVNTATWKAGEKIDRTTGSKLQALLNWHNNGVGPVDGYWGKNTRKAMQAFQKANGLTVTDDLNNETWKALTKNEKLMAQPVLVSYQLSDVGRQCQNDNDTSRSRRKG